MKLRFCSQPGFLVALSFWASATSFSQERDADRSQPEFLIDSQPSCQAIHARSWGITLACCSTKSPLPEHCKYNTPHMCKFPQCSCTVIADVDNVQCSDEAPRREWRDHETSPDDEPFQCRNPNFPNEHGEFVVTLQIRSKPLTKPFLLGLSKYKVVELTVTSHWGGVEENELRLIQDDLFEYFRLLRSLRVFGSANETAALSQVSPRQYFLPSSFGGIDRLEMLSLVNLSSLRQLPDKVDFTSTLRYLLIQNCARLQKLADWVSDLTTMTYAKITRTGVHDISTLSALTGLKFLYMSGNKIVDMSSVVFECEHLQELDLSANEICCIGTMTFSKLTSLKYLDLSENPLKRLPSGGFAKLQNLQWLYLNHRFSPANAKKKVIQASLEAVLPDVFIGLKRLEYLSLENNPSIAIHHQAFASLSSLKSLDLSYCNLSSLPQAVVHLCHLKFLWLKFNRFRSSASIPPATLSMLPLQEMSVFDLSENSLAQNPYALFLAPLENTALMESIVSALKNQPLWWHDACARRHWELRLVLTNSNQTLQTIYANMLGMDHRRESSSSTASSDDVQCDASYKKIMRELEAYETLKESTTCSRLVEQRRINRRFRQQLFLLQSTIKTNNKTPNSTNNACRPVFVRGGAEEVLETPIENANPNRGGDSDSETRHNVVHQKSHRQHSADAVERAFNTAKNDRDDEDGPQGARYIPGGDSRTGGDVFDELPPAPPLPEDCGHLYSTIDIFGYVLAANFVVLICVSLSCIVLLFKRRRRAVETADA